MFDSMELVAIKKLGGKVTQPIDPEFLPPGYGGGGVSDWDDLKNRPFGTEKGETALAETAVSFADGPMSMLPDVLPVVGGKLYSVNWNGVEYLCEAKSVVSPDGITLICLGNLALLVEGENTGEPFGIAAVPADMVEAMGVGAMVMTAEATNSVTLSITAVDVHLMPPIYMPKLIVNFTKVTNAETLNGTADKTLDEILEAIKAGYEVEGWYDVATAIDQKKHYRLQIVCWEDWQVGDNITKAVDFAAPFDGSLVVARYTDNEGGTPVTIGVQHLT